MAVGDINFLGKLSNFLRGKWQWTSDRFFQGAHEISWIGGGEVKVEIDTDSPITAYTDCPHLQLTIDKKAQMFSNGQWRCYDVSDVAREKPLETDPILMLLKSPNALQSGEDFLKQYIFYKDLFSNNFIYKLRGSSLVDPKALWHLPSNLMEIVMTGKVFQQFELSEIIKKYILTWGGQFIDYTVEDTMYQADNFIIDQGKGMSRIPSLKLPINNIVAALKTRNIIIVNKGMFGFMSSDAKDAAGSVSMGTPERKRVEKQFAEDTNLYSEREKIKIVNTPTKWNPMSFPTKDLLLFEEIEDDFATILGTFGMDRDLFPSTKGATFENKKQAEALTYNSTIIPEADSFAQMITKQFGDGKKVYTLDYTWLPILQKDKEVEEKVEKAKAERLGILLDKGIISREIFAEMMGVKLTGAEPTSE